MTARNVKDPEGAAYPLSLMEDLLPWPTPRPRGNGLSPRELRVVAELARGGSTEGIAADLGVSPHTVRTHIRNLMRKLGAETRAHAVALCVAEACSSKGCGPSLPGGGELRA